MRQASEALASQALRELEQNPELGTLLAIAAVKEYGPSNVALRALTTSIATTYVQLRLRGQEELVAVADGTRESTDDWAELLRALRRRGMGAPVVMVGDGALGLWRALREVFPATREQRCWVHVVRNVLGALPKSIHASARRALNEIIMAEDRTHAERAIEGSAADYGIKWPKAVAKVTGETERLLCFFDYPAEHWVHLRTTDESFKAGVALSTGWHWVHLRTTNPIESSFSPVRARTRVTKGPGTRDTGLAMVFKLLQAAEGRWRAVNGPTWSPWSGPARGSRRAS
jgi:putative transposase